MIDRAGLLLAGLPKTARVIEIGPSLNPLAPKRDGWDVTIVDHETREGLIHKYRLDPSVDPEVIEEVDFVWRGGSLVDLLGPERAGTYDAFIASHVIEHTTDVVRFLQAARALLKGDGTVILAVPDKRLCFDFFRPLSTTGDAVAAYIEKRARHSAKTHFDYGMYQCTRDGRPGWEADCRSPPNFVCRIESGLAFAARADMDEYVDAHAWMFTPSSFELMVLELHALGLLDLSVDRCEPTAHTEFHAWLRPCGEIGDADAVARRRGELLERIVIEQAEASRQVVGAPLVGLEQLRAGLRGLLERAT